LAPLHLAAAVFFLVFLAFLVTLQVLCGPGLVIASRAIAEKAADAVLESLVALHVLAVYGAVRAPVDTAEPEDLAMLVPLQTKASQEEKRRC
jgi:hypothetical protein